MTQSYVVGTSELIDNIAGLQASDAPFVMAYALTKTAQDIKAAEIHTMQSVFDRPTKFTLNALFVKPAKKKDLVAEVFFKDGFGSIPAWRYLGPQVEGGPRVHKAHERRLIRAGHMRSDEFAVPGSGAKLDAYGNISGPTIERILSQVGAAEQFAGYQANMTAKSAARAKKKKVGRYFVLRPDGRGRAGRSVAPGIYYRSGLRDIVPVIMFVKPPTYQKRFLFYERARAVYESRLLPNARAGFDKYVLSRLPKAA